MRSTTGGPCCHCGTTITPCWRKGPPEKPTLCNACGSRYLVKGDLVGYYPGARRGSNGRGEGQAPTPHLTIVTKGPRTKAISVAGSKRKSGASGYEGQTMTYSDNELLENLRFELLSAQRAAGAWGTADAAHSDDERQNDDCFDKDYHPYLDASSDEFQEGAPSSTLQASGVAAISRSRPVMFHRRPRKQQRPVACSC